MNIEKALTSLRPKAEWVLRGDLIEWLDSEQTEPTKAEIDTEIARLQVEHDAQEYARNRQAEYPPIGDQLDDLFHRSLFSDEMTAKLQTVKDTYPKG